MVEDSRFPATKQELIKEQGWKAIDLTENRRIHTYALLKELPDKQYDVDEVLNNLSQTLLAFKHQEIRHG